YSTGNADMGGDRVDVVTVGEQTEVTYQTDDYTGGTEILVTVIDPEGQTTEEKLHATAPGKYTAGLSTPQTGLYHFNVRRSEEGEMHSYLTTAAAVQFSDEYKFDVSTDSYLKFVEQYGRIITEEDSVFERISTGARESYPVTNWLIFLALCLFVADVAMRRFQFVPGFVQRGFRGRGAEREQKDGKTAERTAEKKAVNAPQDMINAVSGDKTEQALDTSLLLRKKDGRKI
ncbi:MAG: hypothetical protein K2O13_09885, partial [Lachnospiraceae bacterium]|nr:hypothetical protein [Lachnospiraceae bacterium]